MSDASTFLYFAYGSNMLSRRMLDRAPSARFVSIAVLPDHELRWHKVSRDGSAKCDIVQVVSSQIAVHGVVYEIATAEKPSLDVAEGIGMGYREKMVNVFTSTGELEAWTYQATNTDRLALPYTWYKALVVAGALEHGLPDAYVKAIEATATKPDRDEQRAAQNRQLASAG